MGVRCVEQPRLHSACACVLPRKSSLVHETSNLPKCSGLQAKLINPLLTCKAKVSVVVPCACLSLCLSVCLSITILVLHATAQLMSDIKSVSSASAQKNYHFPEMAVFDLEKLAETWPDPSISVAHAYLYAYSATFGEKRHRRL